VPTELQYFQQVDQDRIKESLPLILEYLTSNAVELQNEAITVLLDLTPLGS
jgi:hypothetical protein